MRISTSTGLFARASLCSQFPEVKQAPRAQQQHDGHADGQNARRLQRGGHPAIYAAFAVQGSCADVAGDRVMVFGYPARQDARHQRRAADNRQALQGGAHHEFQAVARVEQGEETKHHKVGAGQPVPDQREGADKQAKERRVSGRPGAADPRVIAALLWKIRYSAHTRNAQHDRRRSPARQPARSPGWK